MQVIIRDLCEADVDAVLDLNQSEVPHVGSVSKNRMRWYAENAAYFRIALAGERLAAYLVGFRPGSDYDSPNYRWFCDRYEEFAYVDRVAVAPFARRAGLASRLYEDFAEAMPESVGIMTCEVNVRPPNPSSMEFHHRLGFEQVGSLSNEQDDKEVAMLLRRIGRR